ncbi:aldo-keto reductase family 1 member B7-like isoform X2 [Mercenaria mercenaria]|uniref:aldo-keto reductase family 1 member B7-like isoform X2 n=1 Tax=Mercenaria mercenaria TaxID=6596 RepID=UPI00234F34CF|nr:aldo-keto reductase family 1 member B7-like isoform X2 [Mercenaria mercenaria]
MDLQILPLINGTGSIPTIGLGTFVFEQGKPEKGEAATSAAVDARYRHFDCAWNYGTQECVGRALEKKIKDGIIERKDIFITTKLWNTHHNPKLVMEELKDSLKKLQTDYVDMFLIHWPMGLQDQDFSRNVISPKDKNGKQLCACYPLEDIWKIEIWPYFSNKRLTKFCKDKGMVVTAYAPFGCPSRPWKEAEEPCPFEDPVLLEIAERKGKSVAQVIIRFHLQNGISMVPKSVTPSRIKENINVFDFELSEEDMEKIKALDRNLRVFKELTDHFNMDLQTLPLTNGTGSIPTIGLGTFTVFGQRGKPEEVEAATSAAVDAGYRHFDCAWNYGTQEGIGRALEKKIKDGVIERKDIFITTKLWDTHHNPKLVMEELKDSLKKLRTDYVDMFLIHWPTALQDQDFSGDKIAPADENGKVLWACYPLEDIWKEMEKCQHAGMARNIGISNFNSKQTDRIFKCCTIKPTNMQIEISPYFANERLTKFCQEKGMVVTAYAPLGAPSRPWRESGEPSPFEDPVLTEIATRKGKSVAQVIIRFHLQNGISVVPKSITPSRIKENIDVFDFELSEEDMKKIKDLDRNLRVYKEPIAIGHPEYPFDEPF